MHGLLIRQMQKILPKDLLYASLIELIYREIGREVRLEVKGYAGRYGKERESSVLL